MSATVRVALLLDGAVAERWVERIVRGMREDDRFELALVILGGEGGAGAGGGVLWTMYARLDRRLAARPGDALAPVTLDLDGLHVRTAAPESGPDGVPQLSPADVDALREADLDVVLRLGSAGVPEAALGVARSGVWSYRHGGGGPPHFWEMHDGEPAAGVALLAHSPAHPGGRALYRSWSATDPASPHRGRARTSAKAAEFALRRLGDLHRVGPDGLDALLEDGEAAAPARSSRAPTSLATARFLARLVTGWVRRRTRRALGLQRWAIAVRPARDGLPDLRGGGWELVAPPRGHFYADPFVLPTQAPQLVFEDYVEEAGRAHIASLPLPPAGDAVPSPLIEPDWHLSYPFVLEEGGEWFMVPEAAEHRRVQLHRLVGDRWEPDSVLLDDVEAYDSTILHRDGTWWMWVCIGVPGGPVTDEVSLFFADELRGPWHEHPASPVVSDVRRARPAGPLLEVEGRLLRPAQDSSGRYGRAIVIHEITTLDREEYAEREISRLEAADAMPGSHATHTFVRAAGYEVIDVMVGTRTLRR